MACKACSNSCRECEDLGTGSENCQSLDNYVINQLEPSTEYIDNVPDCSLKRTLRNLFRRYNCMLHNIIANICAIWSNIDNILEALDQIQSSVITSNGKIEVPRIIDTTDNPALINRVDLGEITDDTRIGITWHAGSTRRTDTFTVAELKTNDAHISAFNMTDNANSAAFFEIFTKIPDERSLWITTGHSFDLLGDVIDWSAESFDSEGDAYYDEQDPDYTAPIAYVDYITVYDLVDPITIS